MIIGRKIILRHLLEKDYLYLLKIRNDFDLQFRLMSIPQPNNIEKVKDWVNNRMIDPSSLFFIIANKSTDETCGYIQAINIDNIHRRCEMGICLGEEFQGLGLHKEACNLFENYLVSFFNMHKIIIYLLINNKYSDIAFTRAGFKKVGILKQHFYNANKLHDVQIMEKIINSVL